jgi:uncharacterized membrane protein
VADPHVLTGLVAQLTGPHWAVAVTVAYYFARKAWKRLAKRDGPR